MFRREAPGPDRGKPHLLLPDTQKTQRPVEEIGDQAGKDGYNS